MPAAAAEEMMLVPMNNINIRQQHINSRGGEDDAATLDTDKLSYEIFSILESKFLFGYDDHKLWLLDPKPSPATSAADLVSPANSIKSPHSGRSGESGCSRWRVRELLDRLQIGHSEAKYRAIDGLLEVMKEDEMRML